MAAGLLTLAPALHLLLLQLVLLKLVDEGLHHHHHGVLQGLHHLLVSEGNMESQTVIQ